VFIQCAPPRIDVEISSSTCQAKFYSLWPRCGLCLVTGVVLWTEWYSLVKVVSLLVPEVEVSVG